MKKSPVSQMKISATESKRVYLEQIEEMRERRARQLEGRELDFRIKEMHAHMRGTRLRRRRRASGIGRSFQGEGRKTCDT
jgi:hypothetical protein